MRLLGVRDAAVVQTSGSNIRYIKESECMYLGDKRRDRRRGRATQECYQENETEEGQKRNNEETIEKQ